MNLRLLGFTDAPTSDHTILPVLPHESVLVLPVPAAASKRTMIDAISDAILAQAPTAQRTDVCTMARQTVANTRHSFDDSSPAGWPAGYVHFALSI